MKYYITTFPGLGEIAKKELISKWPGVKFDGILQARNNFLVFFDIKIEVTELLKIGIAEDLYVYLSETKLNGKNDLSKIKALIRSQYLDLGLALHRQIRKNKKTKVTTFRVVAQATGEHDGYRRVDAQIALEKGIKEKYKKWKLVDDNAQIEFWLHLFHNEAIVGLRLSDRTMRHRDYKIENMPASLRPTIAYALAFLSGIEENDIVLDPMCGAGTILIERGRAGKYRQLLGGDIRPEAVDIAKKNIGNKYKPISIQVWDATKLPLENESVNKVISNLPFGKQVGSHEENQDLYKKFFTELNRVVSDNGKIVLLTSEYKLVKEILSDNNNFKLKTHYPSVAVLGYHADIFVIEKIKR